VAFLNEKPPEYFRGALVYVVILAETTDGRKIFFARMRYILLMQI
jgi:hypothetical protein